MYSNNHADVVKVFWDGKDKDGNPLGFNDYGFKEAIRRAYKDYMPRTMHRNNVKIGNKEKITEVMLEYICDGKNFQDGKSFLNKIEDWFNNKTNIDQNAYDKWHKECCNKISECFNKYYDNGVTYGKAQKIVNMTMKGIYCLGGVEDYEDWFKHCHMALDSIILEWFKRDVKPIGDEKWSNLDELKYDEYLKEIRNYFATPNRILNTFDINGLSPFQAEFYIWRDMQIHALTEALFSQEFGKEERIDKVCQKRNLPKNTTFNKAKNAFKNFSLEEKLAIVEDAIELIAKEIKQT